MATDTAQAVAPARHCVIGADGGIQADRTEELMAAVGRLLRRG